jgi:hypothetical protein
MTAQEQRIARVEVLAAWAGLVVVLFGAVLQSFGDFGTHQLPNGVSSPVLAMELLAKPDYLPSVVGGSAMPNDRAVMARTVRLDYAVIAAYTVFLVLIGVLRFVQGHRSAGVLVSALVVVAAGFDVLENRAMLGLLEGMTSVPRTWSLVKWSLLFVAIGIAAPAYCDRSLPLVRRLIGYTACVLSMLAAVFGITGVLVKTDSLLEVGATIMTNSLIIVLVFLASGRWLAAGLLDALNRLARTSWLGWLKDWPSDEDVRGIR